MDIEYRDSSGELVARVINLWAEPLECAMCGALGHWRHAVPWYCGPVAEGDSEGGYNTTCEPCHDRWAAWNDALPEVTPNAQVERR